MEFDPNNAVVQLCSKGIAIETNGMPDEAQVLYLQAWELASNDFEKFTAAHYVARLQQSASDKLKWDETALSFALKINDNGMNQSYPSLYLNIAKCYEDLNDLDNARKNYEMAFSYVKDLPDNGYGQMIESGIKNGIDRVTKKK